MMRRIQKQQAEQGIALLEQAHKEIKRQIERRKTDEVKNLLEQCQQYAIALGEMIEKEAGEGTTMVRLLEDYCERVYEIYQEAGRMQPGDAKNVYKKLSWLQPRLKSIMQEKLPVRKEVVFLPYKASMWDSLESIWMAACEDPSCDAYVIPIPYYDKNPDGSLGELHDESGLYPEYVPVTDYQSYSFAERQPDLIFIHNPYDEYNYLTSVHPFFYTRNLKQYTEKLVYVPYFVLEEPNPDDPNQVEGISHFCTTSGVLHADNVIVQSEKMRRIYVDVMTRFTEGHGLTRKDWEGKILGLGSPKLDKVWNAQQEASKIPEEWQERIQKPDGSRKKVILYNTGLTAFLQHSSVYLDKMRDVFCVFRERQEEAVLLWRPHPLLHGTVKTMRPAILEAYEKLLEEYQEERFGIYDDSAKLDRAIAVCDAYYGDPSSVVQLCKEAGRPVMLQNIELIFSEQRGEVLDRPLVFENGYDDGTSLWFTGYEYNSLIKMDKKTHEITWKGIFPDEPFAQQGLYNAAAACGQKLYFAPCMANEIAVYHMKTEKIQKIPLCRPVKTNGIYHEKFHFFRAVSAAKKIYFIPEYYPGLLCYDTERDMFCCFDDWVDKVEEVRVSERRYFTECVSVEDRLILPCACADAVVIFDMAEKKSRVIQTLRTDYPYKFCGVCHTGDFLYLVSADGTVSKRKADDMENEIRRWRLPKAGDEELAFYPVRYMEEAVWLFPFKNGSGYRIDIKTDQVTPFTAFDDEKSYTGHGFLFLCVLSDGEQWYVSTGNSRRFMRYHTGNGKKQESWLYLPPEAQKFLKEYKKKDFADQLREAPVTESAAECLTDLLSFLEIHERMQKDKKTKGNLENGRKIYQTLSMG